MSGGYGVVRYHDVATLPKARRTAGPMIEACCLSKCNMVLTPELLWWLCHC